MEPSKKKVKILCIILSLLIIKATGCVLILIAHDEEHPKQLKAHGFLILQWTRGKVLFLTICF